MKYGLSLSAALLLCIALLSGCGKTSGHANDGKLNVAVTFYPMYEFTKQVAGEHANVTALIPPSVEPHDWEPSAKDMTIIQNADVFVYNGLIEGWADSALSAAPNDKRIAVQASKGISLIEGTAEEEEEHEEDHEEDHGSHGEEQALDPHVWLSPVLAQQEVSAIEQALEQADPAHKADYKTNAAAYIAKLKQLDQDYRAGLQNVKKKSFVTQHAAFGYLAKEYGLTQIPIAGLSPDQEPSPENMAEIVKFAKQNDVKTIFFETLVDPKVARTVADEIGAKTDVLNPLEGLTDEDKTNHLDYISIMTNNLKALQKALNE
ncbi:metal ABC transporter substrate-binding protein [Paenibacillus protaetiae]|uniref:Zinc ABC transporter substrate-binding protein n=1 Tax=Paenibacillus protaetiae TaxID=2509456 RepID=A0A4P6ESB5_9BACL|nr:metal ABC transporter substrate-binding protein [Paenibacillus protaetiae]QAY65784.1 zinc ABC transporter substrate-binding protein [Paenibacillus protaetiae]